MPVSFDTQPTTTARESLPATTENEGKMEVTPERSSSKADNTEVDNRHTEPLSKTRQTKIVDHCPHGTHTLESQLQLRGEPIRKSEAVKDVSRSLVCQIGMTVVFCLLEFGTGVLCSSIAMLADSYHMAADVMALVVAFTCIKIATRPSTRHGYGWVRAETLGGFFNGIFMCTVCVMVFQEAIARCINIHMITSPVQVLIIGSIGLLINLLGMCNLSGHGHSHGGGGGHGHSHGGSDSHGHSHDRRNKKNKKGHGHSHANGHGHSHEEEADCHEEEDVPNCNNRGSSETARPEALSRLLDNEDSDEHIERRLSGVNNQNAIIETVDRQMTPYGTHMASEVLNDSTSTSSSESESTERKKKQKKDKNVNLHGVWLHLLSDAFGSVIVMISATCVLIWPDWRVTAYLDPVLSMCLASIMGLTAIVLVRSSGMKLLKRAPKGLEIDEIKTDLCSIVGVSKVEKVSVWTLCGQRIIASAHVNVCHPAVFPEAAYKIKKYFHDLGVHSTTIEPTFEDACMQSLCVTAVKKVQNGTSTDLRTTVSTENEITDDSVTN